MSPFRDKYKKQDLRLTRKVLLFIYRHAESVKRLD